MLPYFHSASRAIRRWFTPTRRRPIRNARARTPLHLESLEDRTLPSASVSATVANNVLSIVLTDAAADTTTVSIHRKSSDSTNDDYKNLEIVLGGTAQSTTYDLTSLTSIQLQAGAGTDTLTVDQGNGDLNVPVTFLAGTGSDTYSDTGASMSGVLSSHNKVLSIVLTDAAADTTTLSIHRKSSDNTSADYNNLEITLNGTAQSTTYDLTSLTGIQLQAGDGTDTLTVDQGNGDLSLPVTFLAGTGSDTYSDTDADLSGVQSNGDFVLGDQLNTSLSNLQTLIDDNVYNQPLPVVATTGSTTGSNKLQDVGQADIIGTFSATLQNALDNTSDTNPNGLASTAGPADIQKALYAALGPSGANLLQDKPGDTDKKTDINDVVVVANNGTFSYQMSLANQNHAYDTATLLDFDPGLAGLPLTLSDQSQQKVQTEFGYKYDLKFDIANSAAASIDNSTTSSQPLLIDLNARLNSGYEDKNATFGLLSADITDSTSFPTTLNAQYHVTFSGSGNSSAASAKVDGVAFIDPHMVLSVMPNQLGPDSLTGGPNSTGDTINLKFFADMTTTWHFGTSTAPVALGPLTAFGSKPTVSFAMSMDPNSFFLNFVRTIVKDDILPEFKSIQSLVDALDYKVPGLGIGLDDLLDNAVLGTTQALTAVGNFRGFFESIHKFQLLAQDLASFPAFTVFPLQLVDLGSFSISQDARTKNSNTSTDTRTNAFVTIQPSDVTPPPATDPYTLLPKGDPLTQLRRLANDIGHLIDDLNPVDDPFGKQFQVGFPVNFFDMIQESVTYGLGGGQPDSFKTVTFDLLQFPMLDSPAGGSDHTAINIFNMLMGHHESLLTWTTPPVILNVNGTYRISPPTLNGGFDLRLVPNIQFLAHFAGGFDTHGLESADPNQGYYLTRADPAESDRSDITTLVDQVTNDPNTLQSTFMSLTVSIGLDPGFQLSNILANTGLGNVLDALGVDVTFTLGLTFGGHRLEAG